MYLVLSICEMFISIMQSVNGARFLNTKFLPTICDCAGPAIRLTVIVPLTSIYASL